MAVVVRRLHAALAALKLARVGPVAAVIRVVGVFVDFDRVALEIRAEFAIHLDDKLAIKIGAVQEAAKPVWVAGADLCQILLREEK